jgi:Putative binding domain, N-terminal
MRLTVRNCSAVLQFLFIASCLTFGAASVSAQTVNNPRTVEFQASTDHDQLLEGGEPVVTRYDLEIYQVGSATPYRVVDIGKPGHDGAGFVQLDLTALIDNPPVGVDSEARIVAIGPNGLGRSTPSNAFMYAGECSFALSSTNFSATAAGGSSNVQVTTAATCAWAAASPTSWITIVGSDTFTGPGSVNFTVAANGSSSPRTGTLTIAGQTVTVAQAGQPCSFTLSSSGQSIAAAGGTGSFNVTAGGACGWTAVSSAGWLTVTGGASGTGNGAVSFSAAANGTTSTRTATITVNGQVFTVTQAGTTSCNYTLTPTSRAFVAGGGTNKTFTVTTTAGCGWTAVSSASWVTITAGASGTGNGTVRYNVAANTSSARTATITVNGRVHTVTQAAGTPPACTFTASASPAAFGKNGGSGVASVSTGPGCGWTASSPNTWIHVAVGSGSGSGQAGFTVDSNSSLFARQGQILIGGQTVVITQ